MNNLNKRAKEIIEEILYITIATSSKDGQPWNSPVYSAYDENYNFYWASWKENQHSKNIAENPNVFIVIFNSKVAEGTGDGVYVKATAQMLTEEGEISQALKFLDGRVGKKKDSKTRIVEFQGDNPRRVYKAVPEKFWINEDGVINGKYVDTRKEVKLIEP